MKNKLGITEGEWEYSIPQCNITSYDGFGHLYFLTAEQNEEAISKFINNAKLICDAGNTAQKCGLLPSELLEQRDQLIECVSELFGEFSRNEWGIWRDLSVGVPRYYTRSKLEKAASLLKQIKGE